MSFVRARARRSERVKLSGARFKDFLGFQVPGDVPQSSRLSFANEDEFKSLEIQFEEIFKKRQLDADDEGSP